MIVCNICKKTEPVASLAATLNVPTLDIAVHICRACIYPIGERIMEVVQRPGSTEEEQSQAAVTMFDDVLKKFGEALIQASVDTTEEAAAPPAHPSAASAPPAHPSAASAPPAAQPMFKSFKT